MRSRRSVITTARTPGPVTSMRAPATERDITHGRPKRPVPADCEWAANCQDCVVRPVVGRRRPLHPRRRSRNRRRLDLLDPVPDQPRLQQQLRRRAPASGDPVRSRRHRLRGLVRQVNKRAVEPVDLVQRRRPRSVDLATRRGPASCFFAGPRALHACLEVFLRPSRGVATAGDRYQDSARGSQTPGHGFRSAVAVSRCAVGRRLTNCQKTTLEVGQS